MSSENANKKLRESFNLFSERDRKLLAAIIMGFSQDQYFNERFFINAVAKSGLTDANGSPFNATTYNERVRYFKRQGFAQKDNRGLYIPKGLHHELLLLLSEHELAWACSFIQILFSNNALAFSDTDGHSSYVYENSGQIKAHLSRAVYANEADYFEANSANLIYGQKLALYLRSIFADTLINIEWLRSRKMVIQRFILIALLSDYYCEVPSAPSRKELLSLFKEQETSSLSHEFINYHSAIIYLNLGDISNALVQDACIQDRKSGASLAIQASVAFLNAQMDNALILYRKALTALRKHYRSRSYYFDNFLGVFHSLCLAYSESNLMHFAEHEERYANYADHHPAAKPMAIIYQLLPLIALVEQGKQKEAAKDLHEFTKFFSEYKAHPFSFSVYQLVFFVINKDKLSANAARIHIEIKECIDHEQHFAAHLLQELITHTDEEPGHANAYLKDSTIPFRWFSLIQVKSPWEYSFQALEGLIVDGHDVTILGSDKKKRLLWLVDPDNQEVSVVEQSLTKNKQWSAGRAISLRKLKMEEHSDEFNYLSAEDRRVIACINCSNEYWRESYDFDPYRTLPALVGHRHVAHYRNREVALELLQAEPELYIEEDKKGYRLSLSHWLPEEGILLEPESMNRYRVVEFSKDFANIARILTKKGLSVPAVAKDKIVHVIQNAKRDLKIHVGIKDIDIPGQPGDITPYIQLLPVKNGLKATLWVRPMPNHGNYCKAAQGKEHLMIVHTENGIEQRLRIHRDFSLEKTKQEQVLAHCPALVHHEIEPSEYEIEEPEHVLEVLSELQHYAAHHPLIIEWPQGQTFKIKQRIFAKDLSLNISSQGNWFEYSGAVTLDNGDVLNMRELLEALDSSSYGRFVRLESGEFLEMTSQLRKQLQMLHTLSDGTKINPLGAQVLSDIASEAEHTTFDAGWQEHLLKIKKMKKHSPKVPSTLQVSLRDYQVDGFHYLSRLTHWGIGACLADDMGLGKTVQTIALILERAKKGPSLVIAPTSVCFNWIGELNRFAPTLKIYNFRDHERDSLVKQLDKFDVLICSYGLLHHNDTLLSEKSWETIVLDEAQAIKNANTQRWKAVMKLRGNSRIALSGTPIENHLGELWSIFSFLNPGLLGSIKDFQNKYVTPIESGQSQIKVHALKTLVSPYILRRLKSDVLSELPPKTEQTIHVEQSKEEASFYEALRLRAEERMRSFMEENNRIAVLAEITKLRQACCDSSLVDETIKLENSKINAFIETVKNIIDNGHKALVFSQYVSFLSLIKVALEAEQISYQYLDGTTSAPKRKKAVDSFQAGEGDLFLLSLKAGGSGLNLTAADYVIHLDPWWNPAVEDQASDRAHRIGQERPVTVYRFIMQNTIEEKIIKLHEQKRNLANELLSGQGISGKLSNDDLMALIHSGYSA